VRTRLPSGSGGTIRAHDFNETRARIRRRSRASSKNPPLSRRSRKADVSLAIVTSALSRSARNNFAVKLRLLENPGETCARVRGSPSLSQLRNTAPLTIIVAVYMPRDSLAVTFEYVNRHESTRSATAMHACAHVRARAVDLSVIARVPTRGPNVVSHIVTKRGPQAHDDMPVGLVGGTKTLVTWPQRPRVTESGRRERGKRLHAGCIEQGQRPIVADLDASNT